MDAVFEQPVETDKYWADDKQRTAEVLQADTLWMEARPGGQQADCTAQDRTCAEGKVSDKHWAEGRHPERQWTVDRHTQRQIDRKIEKQWVGGRKIDRSWSENRSADVQLDSQWTASRRTERQMLQLAQRPSPPYPAERAPSPSLEAEPPKGTEGGAGPDRHQPDSQGDRQMFPEAAGGLTDGWRGSAGGRAALSASKPDPPPQASKQHLPKPRHQRHHPESSDSLAGVFGRRTLPQRRALRGVFRAEQQLRVLLFFSNLSFQSGKQTRRRPQPRRRNGETPRDSLHPSQKRWWHSSPCQRAASSTDSLCLPASPFSQRPPRL